MTRDGVRFRRADTDADGKLTKEEFPGFQQPELYDHMKRGLLQKKLFMTSTE